MFEALHVAGGVLKYGIPEFRLPDMIVDVEIENLKKMGVEIRLDSIIGKLFTIPQTSEKGYDTAFVGTGAGSPKFMEIPGQAFNGVFGQRIPDPSEPDAGLPAADLRYARGHGRRVAVVGAGNTAMDAAAWPAHGSRT